MHVLNGLECEINYTIIAGGTINGDLAGPRSSHEIINQLCLTVEVLELDDLGKCTYFSVYVHQDLKDTQ